MPLATKAAPGPKPRELEAAPLGGVVFAREATLTTEVEQLLGTAVESYAALDAVEWDKRAAPRVVFLDVDGGASSVEGENDPAAVIARVKEHWPAAPIFVVHTGDDAATIEALAQGADDFLTRPIAGVVTAQRIDLRVAAMERKAARETIRFGDILIDTLQRSVSSQKGQKFLSPTEIRLISELAKAGGNVVGRDMLKARCWPSSNVSDNALNRKLYEIRRRIKPLSEHINIRTVYGVGFVLENKM